MAKIKAETRDAIRQLYFGEGWSTIEIAEELRLSLQTVRRALVIDGGARGVRSPGPYQESDS